MHSSSTIASGARLQLVMSEIVRSIVSTALTTRRLSKQTGYRFYLFYSPLMFIVKLSSEDLLIFKRFSNDFYTFNSLGR
jgi:hypothetical protein